MGAKYIIKIKCHHHSLSFSSINVFIFISIIIIQGRVAAVSSDELLVGGEAAVSGWRSPGGPGPHSGGGVEVRRNRSDWGWMELLNLSGFIIREFPS